MAAEIRIPLRVQFLSADGETWKTINLDGVGDDVLAMTGPVIDMLARWVEWFEENPETHPGDSELCAACLRRMNEGGHAEDCVYAVTKALLSESENAE